MAQFEIDILGCGSATPSVRHNTSSQAVDFRDTLMLVDCGEGTQQQVRRMGLKFSRIRRIFISHLHGDHCLGLPGLLSTLSLHGKTGEIEVYMPEHGIELFTRMTNFFLKESGYEIKFIPISGVGGQLVDDPSLTVTAFPLFHRVPCYGFVFREKPKLRHLNGEMVKYLNIPVYKLNAIKEGADWVTPEGRTVPNSRLTTAADPSYSYAYCSDTMFERRVIEAVEGVDVIYHETTYEKGLREKAFERGHSTSVEAATVAKEAGAKLLVIGHYSKRYPTPELLLAEAREVFPNVIAADEGMRIDIPKILKND